MSRSSTLMLLGVLVVIAPFSGLPITFRNTLEIIFGLAVLGAGVWLRAADVRAAGPASAPEVARSEEPVEVVSVVEEVITPTEPPQMGAF